MKRTPDAPLAVEMGMVERAIELTPAQLEALEHGMSPSFVAGIGGPRKKTGRGQPRDKFGRFVGGARSKGKTK